LNAKVRQFDSGATRNLDDGKVDFEGFLSPLVLERYAQYMHKHRQQADGSLRDSDNWQRGIPLPVYMKSAWRHFFDVWKEHRGISTPEGLEDSLCALLFNISGYLHEHLKGRGRLAVHIDTAGLTAGELATLASPAPGVIIGHVPPFVQRDADDDMGLKAGEAVSYGGTAE
jgi:hypothetical protein